MTWEPYAAPSVTGDLRRCRVGARELLAWLPPSYEAGSRAYPVVYLLDAQNLFDEATGNGGEWRVDETLTELAAAGLELIAVGVPHADDARADEYAGDGLEPFVAVLVDEIVPLVERAFRTGRPRAIGGSSLGGYASLYALFARPDVFDRALVMSPAFWWDRARIVRHVEARDAPRTKVWMDVGGREHEDESIRIAYVEAHARMTELLRAKGFDETRLRAQVDEEAVHHESAWADRLPDALRFLFG